MIPLLSPKPFAEYGAEEYQNYIRSLYQEPPKAAPPAEFAVRLNAKGNPVLTVRRDPKWLSSAEVQIIAQELGWSLQHTWLHVVKKKVAIRTPEGRE